MSHGSPQRQARLFDHVAVVESVDAATMDELLAGPLARHVVRRLTETVVVIDHAYFDPIVAVLNKAGYTPRITDEGRS